MRQNPLQIYEYQSPATLNQAGPVQNTWYTILDTTANCRIYDIILNVEDTDETLECKITVDGETVDTTGFSLSATHSTDYRACRYPSAITRTDHIRFDALATYYHDLEAAPLIEGKSIKIEARKTSAAGVGNLTGIVTYGVLKPC